MACNIEDGIGRPECPGETPGAYDTFWLFNRDAVTAFTLTAIPGPGASTSNTVEDITFTPGEGFYQVVARKASVVGREEKQDNDTDATDYTHEFDFRLTDLSSEARDWVNDLNGANLGAIIRTKGDKFILYGYNDGVQMKVNNMSTEAEELGEFVTMRETQVGEKTRRFFDTDVTTTLATIASKVVGS
jgi:hypothetical protein